MRWIGVLVVLAGCRQLLGFENAAGPADGPEPDMVVLPDATACTTLSRTCLGDVLRDCAVIGELPVDTTCSWGCLDAPEAHCGQLDPAANILALEDLVDTPELGDLAIVAPTTINTDTGEITGLRPAGPGVINGVEFELTATAGVFRLRGLLIGATASTTGQRALAIAALGDVAIAGVLDLRGACAQSDSGPGGRPGGSSGNDGLGPGGAQAGDNAGADSCGGGGGAGHGDAGAKGGDSQNGAEGGAGGPSSGSLEILQLVGGSGGGGGARPAGGGRGGGGGGAVHLVSNTRIAITTGGIDAGGCGGKKSLDNTQGGGGGGSGGAILLEAPTIEIAGGGLAANGGGGGSGGDDADGQPGQLQLEAAAGGLAVAVDTGSGGTGGAAGQSTGAPGENARHAGGGGGSVGRIRLHTRAGSVMIGPGGFTSPMIGEAAASQGTAVIR